MCDMFQVLLLDRFGLRHNGTPIPLPLSAERLVAFLGVRRSCLRTEIAGMLWPDLPGAKAHGCLRTVLWRLRCQTKDPLVTGRDLLTLASGTTSDLESLIVRGRAIVGGGAALGEQPTVPATLLGELLPGWHDDWVLFERERLRQVQLHTLEAVAAQLVRAGRCAEAVDIAFTAIRMDPLRESATSILIKAYLAENNVAEALRRIEYFRRCLRRELGIEPTAALWELVRQARAGAPPRTGRDAIA
jgi:DNA-binding SARP family transcriptional activator